MVVPKFQVDPDKRFQKAIQDALTQVKDLTVPLTLIAKDWFQANKAIFKLRGPGKYPDLSPGYKKEKQRNAGFVYPILRRSGVLETSVTDPSSGNSINLIINKNTLYLGTKVRYASAHQFGTKYLPIRPIIFTGGEQAAPDEHRRRSKLWIDIIKQYVLQKSQGFGAVTKT